uniref:Trigger factor ribosome-binding bacterial domain-containing protein n=1 Tax=Corethron hystrix TaxID=216773 RepID=A0A7S1G3V1_9STRA|mmetsp:Transcript_9656/g.21451  ORF Transcript_9656/g.21451 Transcript_9656/m.21451 type:complete len:230 (+) Transcript_9656:171-860(+)
MKISFNISVIIAIACKSVLVCSFSSAFTSFGRLSHIANDVSSRTFVHDTSIRLMNFNFDKVLNDDNEDDKDDEVQTLEVLEPSDEKSISPLPDQSEKSTNLAEEIAKISRSGSTSDQMISRIKGCEIRRIGGSGTTFEISVDGDEADLGNFSKVVYKKIIMDAKQQQFQGFRPGTIPPFLDVTYRLFAMDEVAREATSEALEQVRLECQLEPCYIFLWIFSKFFPIKWF